MQVETGRKKNWVEDFVRGHVPAGRGNLDENRDSSLLRDEDESSSSESAQNSLKDVRPTVVNSEGNNLTITDTAADAIHKELTIFLKTMVAGIRAISLRIDGKTDEKGVRG